MCKIRCSEQTSWYAMAEALIDDLVRIGSSDARSVRAIRASLRIFMDKLSKLQGFYSGLSGITLFCFWRPNGLMVRFL